MKAMILKTLTVLTLAGTAACGGAGGGGGGGGGGSSEASCAAPALTATADLSHKLPRLVVSPGQTLRVYGHGYATCHDTNHQPAARPYSHLEVLVVQGQNRFPVTTVSARQDGTFQVWIRMPGGLRPGTATIGTSQAGEMPLTVHIAGLQSRLRRTASP